MKQDTIFYQLFKRSPTLLFELLANFPPQAADYRFDSVEVKETAFRADGVFLPPTPEGNVYFGEVQQAKDNLLYERLMAEVSIFAYRDRDSFKDWQSVVIYPSRDIEQERLELVQEFLASGRITRIYLDELGEIRRPPLGFSPNGLNHFAQRRNAGKSPRNVAAVFYGRGHFPRDIQRRICNTRLSNHGHSLQISRTQ
jgi:predicted transposase YdaD